MQVGQCPVPIIAKLDRWTSQYRPFCSFFDVCQGTRLWLVSIFLCSQPLRCSLPAIVFGSAWWCLYSQYMLMLIWFIYKNRLYCAHIFFPHALQSHEGKPAKVHLTFCLVVSDAAYGYVHLQLHRHRALWKHIHSIHHEYKETFVTDPYLHILHFFCLDERCTCFTFMKKYESKYPYMKEPNTHGKVAQKPKEHPNRSTSNWWFKYSTKSA